MKFLIIDSHKGSQTSIPQNLHWQNAKKIADLLGADLIWSYPTVNDNIKENYDVIIFNHASQYSYVDYLWLEKSPNAKIYHITNEYNLGEPRILWMAVKRAGRKYDVIANHPEKASKIVSKYVNNWNILNLNSIIFDPKIEHVLNSNKSGCVYYGSFRKERSIYFEKYLTKDIILSTHSKNVEKFRNAGALSDVVKRIDWAKSGIGEYRSSLYIENTKTHTYYNYLANRFYEALNYGVTPIFANECRNTINLSGYSVPDDYIITDSLELRDKRFLNPLDEWYDMAESEKNNCLLDIVNIVSK